MERKLTPMDQLFWYSAKESPVNFTCYAHIFGRFSISDLEKAGVAVPDSFKKTAGMK